VSRRKGPRQIDCVGCYWSRQQLFRMKRSARAVRFPLERLEDLRRLSSLVEICSAARPRPSHSRWPLIGAFACTLLIASVLLFARPKTQKVRMDLRVDQIGFSLPNRQLLSEQLRLSALSVSGLKGIQLPRALRFRMNRGWPRGEISSLASPLWPMPSAKCAASQPA